MFLQNKIKNKATKELFNYFFMTDTTGLFCSRKEGCFASFEHLRVKQIATRAEKIQSWRSTFGAYLDTFARVFTVFARSLIDHVRQ